MKKLINTPTHGVLRKREAPGYENRAAMLNKLRIILYLCIIFAGLFFSVLSLLLIAKKNNSKAMSALSGSAVFDAYLNQSYVSSGLTWISFGLIIIGVILFLYERKKKLRNF